MNWSGLLVQIAAQLRRRKIVCTVLCLTAVYLVLSLQPAAARMLKPGPVVSVDLSSSAYQVAIEQTTAVLPIHTHHDDFRYAVLDYFNEDYQNAYKRFQPLAEQGDSGSEYYLALMYDEGRGVEKDASTAVHWYKRAAQQGHMDAQYNLGVAYASGAGVERDMSQAVNWWEKAAQRGSVDAEFNLGLVYYTGRGVIEVNLDSALVWWQKAADHGDAIAQFHLGMMYAIGKGTDQDLCIAGRLWRYAASQGHDEAIIAFQDLYRELPSLGGCWDLLVDAGN